MIQHDKIGTKSKANIVVGCTINNRLIGEKIEAGDHFLVEERYPLPVNKALEWVGIFLGASPDISGDPDKHLYALMTSDKSEIRLVPATHTKRVSVHNANIGSYTYDELEAPFLAGQCD